MNEETKLPDKYSTFDVTNPSGIVQVYRDYYWWCVGGDPTKALFYYFTKKSVGAPQCNYNRDCCEAVGERLGYSSFASVVKIPLAFVPCM